jgi:hypothetical protein
LGHFEFFRKITEIIAGQGAPPVPMTLVANLPPVSTTPAANFATSSACAVDTGGKFATGVNKTGRNFAASVNNASGNNASGNNASGKLPPVSSNNGTISDCRHRKVNLNENLYMLTLLH